MIRLRVVKEEDINDDFLTGYQRDQVTHKIHRFIDGRLEIIDEYFVETWDNQKLTEISRYLKSCVHEGGKVVALMNKDKCIGFANIENKVYFNTYLPMHYCHISKPYRNKGLGKKLFFKMAAVASDYDVEKLYISTHPAVETQAFYKSIGCVLTNQIVPELLEIEPYDIQLEYDLKKEKI